MIGNRGREIVARREEHLKTENYFCVFIGALQLFRESPLNRTVLPVHTEEVFK